MPAEIADWVDATLWGGVYEAVKELQNDERRPLLSRGGVARSAGVVLV